MTIATVVSSQVIAAGEQAFINLIGSSGQLQIFDSNNNLLGTFQLGNPAAVVFNNVVVFNGMPTAINASSNAPVGAVPAYANILNGAGVMLVSGLPAFFSPGGLVLASSDANPGQQMGLVSMSLTGIAGV